VGDGIVPVRKMLEALFVTKYKGFVDLEYEIHPEDPMPGVIASFAYMRGVLAGMGGREPALNHLAVPNSAN
jgi:sugar phosphate isomerase/epimerase